MHMVRYSNKLEYCIKDHFSKIKNVIFSVYVRYPGKTFARALALLSPQTVMHAERRRYVFA